ncbi:tetratricopeptide repeat protein [Methanospirillum sp.]|uniref:tetratricopeptide repeat protein n=1 Tax=Methanospirillum sp. TaxID=45200 RepID=UPI002CE23649|nr:tetratricopeptide repeat protein [Methanospirillum sp.]HPP79081.1 tetratricopeptide repeat protein [Methanospirillum sp.]
MSHLTSILFVLAITLIILGSPSGADVNKTYYNGYSFDPELVPSGMIPYEPGWSHGSLFSAPNWLLAQIDQNLTSTVLDRGVTPTPTPVIASDAYETYMSEGFAALEGGNYRAAYTAFQAATELKPDSSDAWYGLGIALESQKRFLSALDAYTKAISYAQGASSKWASYAGKGRVLYSLNRYAEAKSALETAIEQYEKAGVSHPDEREEISRLLEELNQRNIVQNPVPMSAYIPPVVSGV